MSVSTIILVKHKCGHQIEYQHTRGQTGAGADREAHEVPLNCPDCWEKDEMLTCAICHGRHSRSGSVISGVTGIAVGKDCLHLGAQDGQTTQNAI